MKRSLLFAMPAALVLVLAAAATHPSRTAARADPCSVLKTDEISAAIEVNVEPGNPAGATVCVWQPAKQPTGTIRKVTITLLTPPMYAAMAMSTPRNRWTKTAVTGVGDEAVSATSSDREDATLAVKKGDKAFVLRVYGFPLDKLLIKEKALALAAVGRV